MNDQWKSLDETLKKFVIGLELTAKALEEVVQRDKKRVQGVLATIEHIRKQQEEGKKWAAATASGK